MVESERLKFIGLYIRMKMIKRDKAFAENLRRILRAVDSSELVRTPAFLDYLKFESRKRKMDPAVFFTHPEDFISKVHKIRKRH